MMDDVKVNKNDEKRNGLTRGNIERIIPFDFICGRWRCVGFIYMLMVNL
jgi:hypothetical protein